MKRIVLLGATGSIGRQALEIIDAHPELELVAAASGSQPIDGLAALTQVGGEIVGLVAVGASRDADAEGELLTIYVNPVHWGTGVGRELIRAGEERMRELGYGRVVLWMLDGNSRAQRFYESAGWTLDGERRTIEFVGQSMPEVRFVKQL